MLVQLRISTEPAFDIFNRDHDVSLVPENLMTTTRGPFADYEVIQGYATAVNIQPYRNVEGVPWLKKTQEHARITANFWFSEVSPAINEVYNSVKNKLKITQDTVDKYLGELLVSLENAEDSSGLIDMIQMYIDDIEIIEEKIKNLVEKLSKFREHLEEDTRNYGKVFIELAKQQSLKEKRIECLRDEINEINKKIVELNKEITAKKVKAGELKRKIAINAVFWFFTPALIALAIYQKKLVDVNVAWARDEKTLTSKRDALEKKTLALAETEKRVAYLTTIHNEFTKLRNGCRTAITTVVNMHDAWGTLRSNLCSFQRRLTMLKGNERTDFSEIKSRIERQLGRLKTSINKLNTDIDDFNEVKRIKVPVDEEVENLLLPNRAQLMLAPVGAFNTVLLNAYAQRMHKQNRIKQGR